MTYGNSQDAPTWIAPLLPEHLILKGPVVWDKMPRLPRINHLTVQILSAYLNQDNFLAGLGTFLERYRFDSQTQLGIQRLNIEVENNSRMFQPLVGILRRAYPEGILRPNISYRLVNAQGVPLVQSQDVNHQRVINFQPAIDFFNTLNARPRLMNLNGYGRLLQIRSPQELEVFLTGGVLPEIQPPMDESITDSEEALNDPEFTFLLILTADPYRATSIAFLLSRRLVPNLPSLCLGVAPHALDTFFR